MYHLLRGECKWCYIWTRDIYLLQLEWNPPPDYKLCMVRIIYITSTNFLSRVQSLDNRLKPFQAILLQYPTEIFDGKKFLMSFGHVITKQSPIPLFTNMKLQHKNIKPCQSSPWFLKPKNHVQKWEEIELGRAHESPNQDSTMIQNLLSNTKMKEMIYWFHIDCAHPISIIM